MTWPRRHAGASAALAAAALTVVIAAGQPVGAVPTATHKVTGGRTTITLNADARKTLHAHGFTLTATRPATLSGAKLTSPVTGGTYSGFSATVRQAGGFRIAKGGAQVTVRKAVDKTDSFSGTAIVTGHGRIKAVTVTLPTSMHDNSPHSTTFSGYTVTLAAPLVHVLDHTFGTKLFANHAKIGTGSTTLRYK